MIERLLESDALARKRRKHRRTRKRGGFSRWVRAWLQGMFATFVLIPGFVAAAIAAGLIWWKAVFLLGPVLLFGSWLGILYVTLFKRPAPPRLEAENINPAGLAALPQQTETWLEDQRRALPYAAEGCIDTIVNQLEMLGPQLRLLDAKSPAAFEVRRLLAEELPELVRSYQKVPKALAQLASHGGPSPERQLIDGLNTISTQIGRMHEQLAASDLHALATHHRYLELKYKDDADKLE